MSPEELQRQHGVPENRCLWFDAKSFDDPEAYVDLLDGLLSACDGALCISDVTWTFGPSSIAHGDLSAVCDLAVLTCSAASNPLSLKLVWDRWFDGALIDWLNARIGERDATPSRFAYVATGDQTLLVAFVDPAVHDQLQRTGLLVDAADARIDRPANWDALAIATPCWRWPDGDATASERDAG
jgi:hypothetical protein